MVETVPDSNRHLTCDKKGIFKLQDALPFTPTASMYRINVEHFFFITRLQRFRECLHRQFFVPMQFILLLDAD